MAIYECLNKAASVVAQISCGGESWKSSEAAWKKKAEAFKNASSGIEQERPERPERLESCQGVIDKFDPIFWGDPWAFIFGDWSFNKGCLGSKNYLDKILCVQNFLKEYDFDVCGGNELYYESIEVLLKGLFSENAVARTWSRKILKNHGFFDYQKKLSDLENIAKNIKSRIPEISWFYPDIKEKMGKAAAREIISGLLDYLKHIKVQAILLTASALFLREKPKKTGINKMQASVIAGLIFSFKSLDHLSQLGPGSDNVYWNQVYQVYINIKEWKQNQKKVYSLLIDVMKYSLDFGMSEQEEAMGKWVDIKYLDHNNNWQETKATKEFAEEWGYDGASFYLRIMVIDKIIKESERKVDRMSLKGLLPFVKGNPADDLKKLKMELATAVYDPIGNLKKAKLSEDQTIQDITFAKKSVVWFYESGRLKKAWPSEDLTIQGVKCTKASVLFHENGQLKEATLSKDQTVKGVKCAKGSKVLFHKNGKLDEAMLSEDQTILGVKCKKGSCVEFYNNGKLYKSTLSEDQVIHGVKTEKGSIVWFNGSGEVLKVF